MSFSAIRILVDQKVIMVTQREDKQIQIERTLFVLAKPSNSLGEEGQIRIEKDSATPRDHDASDRTQFGS